MKPREDPVAWLQTCSLSHSASSPCPNHSPLSSGQPLLLISLSWQSSASFNHPSLISINNRSFGFWSSFSMSHPLLWAVHLPLFRLWLSEPESSRKNPEGDPFPWHFPTALPASLTSFWALSPSTQCPSHCPSCCLWASQAHTCFKVMPPAVPFLERSLHRALLLLRSVQKSPPYPS